MPLKKHNPGCPCCDIKCRGCPGGAPPYLLYELTGFKAGGFQNVPECELFNGTYMLAYGEESTSDEGLSWMCNYYGSIPCTVDSPYYGESVLPCSPCNFDPNDNYLVRGLLKYYTPDHPTAPDTWQVDVFDTESNFHFQQTGAGELDCLALNGLLLPRFTILGCCNQDDIECRVTALT